MCTIKGPIAKDRGAATVRIKKVTSELMRVMQPIVLIESRNAPRERIRKKLEETQKWILPADALHLLKHSEKLSTCDQLIHAQCGTQQSAVIGASCPVQECQPDVQNRSPKQHNQGQSE